MEASLENSGGLERRRHQRYKVRGETFAFLGEDSAALVDISKGGLSFHFTVFENDPVIPSHLDIFHAQPHFYLRNLPCTLVSEVQIIPSSIFSLLRVKRFSIQFGPLSSEQVAQLEGFIASHSVVEN